MSWSTFFTEKGVTNTTPETATPKISSLEKQVECLESVDPENHLADGPGREDQDDEETNSANDRLPPNISLNIHNRTSRKELHWVAAIGVVLQFGVLVYSGFATYHPKLRFAKGGHPVKPYAFPTAALGTLLLAVSMLICSHVVEGSTEERRYNATPKSRAGVRILWLQKSQSEPVNDQSFDSFAILAKDPRQIITTSRRTDSQPEVNDSYSEGEDVPERFKILTTIGTMLGLCGFVIQFVGLRGMHWSATISQLAAMLVMTILRAWVRRGLANRPKTLRLPLGHEIDWLATKITSEGEHLWGGSREAENPAQSRWQRIRNTIQKTRDMTRMILSTTPKVQPRVKRQKSESNNVPTHQQLWQRDIVKCGNAAKYEPLQLDGEDETAYNKDRDPILRERINLGQITRWPGPGAERANSLATAIETVMNAVFPAFVSPNQKTVYTWSMEISANKKIKFSLKHSDEKWRADVGEIEAALSLWLFSVLKKEAEPARKKKSFERRGTQDDSGSENTWLQNEITAKRQNMRLFGSSANSLRRDLGWWIGGENMRVFEVHETTVTNSDQLQMKTYSRKAVKFEIKELPDEEDTTQGKADSVEILSHRVVGFVHSGPEDSTQPNPTPKLQTSEQDPQNNAINGDNVTAVSAQPRTNSIISGKNEPNDQPTASICSSKYEPNDKPTTSIVPEPNDQPTASISLGENGPNDKPASIASGKNEPNDKLASGKNEPNDQPSTSIASGKDELNDNATASIVPEFNDQPTANISPGKDELNKKPANIASEPNDQPSASIASGKYEHNDQPSASIASGKDEPSDKATANIVQESNDQPTGRITLDKDEPSDKLASIVLEPNNQLTASIASDKDKPNDKPARIVSEPNNQSDASVASGKKGPNDQPLLAAVSEVPLDLLFAQEMFSCFMWAVAKALKGPIQGRTTTHKIESSDETSSWQSFTLQNTTLSRIAQDVHRTGLGSLEDVYLSIIPPLSIERKLPVASVVIELARQNAKKHELAGHWKEAGNIYRWLFERCKTFGSDDVVALSATAVLLEFFRSVTITLNVRTKEQYEQSAIDVLKELRSTITKELKEFDANVLSSLGQMYVFQGRIERSDDLKEDDWKLLLGDTWNSSYSSPPTHFGFCELHEIAKDGEYYKVDNSNAKHIYARDILNWTPLHYAVISDDESTVQKLLSIRADVYAADLSEWTPLHYASWGGNHSTGWLLLQEGARVDMVGRDGITPLHCAAMNGMIDILELLIQGGANIEAQDVSRKTPLHWAVCNGHKKVVDALLQQGAHLSSRDHSGRTPMHLAVRAEAVAIIKLLFNKDNGQKEVRDRSGRTPLHWAARNGHGAIIRLLIETFGADKDAKDNDGSIPLHDAAESGHEAIVRLLIETFGVDKEAKNNTRRTPLHNAASNGHEAIVRLLVEAGADKDAKSSTQFTPLHIAAYNGHEAVVRLLIETFAADKDTRTADKSTPLIWAAYNGHEAVVRVLVEFGADIDARDEIGYTPLIWAVYHGYEAIVRLLVMAGADKRVENDDGTTALEMATRYDYKAIIQLLQ